MTALETQLTEIVEKEQGQKIIPFLQKLTQEERESLIPCLSRLEEYYNKFVQLEERTYGTRATSGQHHIIDLAALVIFPLKEFRKHEWGINTAHLNEIAAWHIPTWLDSYFVEGEGKEFGGFYNMDYEILMDWIERGILTVSPSPQTIAGYLVNYIHTTPVLEKRDITINEHIWYLFEYDCGQNWHANPAKGYPYYTFQHFTENGKLDRMRVLKESLLAINRNFNKNLCSWFAGMFTALNPSVEEQLTLQPEMFAALSSPHSRPINIILGLLKNLCSHPRFLTDDFLDQTTVLFASDVKAVHQNTLGVLSKLAKEKKEYHDAICCAATQGLMSRDESTQNKIVKLIQTFGETESPTLKEALSAYAETMLTSTKKELAAYLKDNVSDALSTDKVLLTTLDEQANVASFDYEPMPPILREDNRIQEITSIEDLLFLASQILDSNELYHFDLFLNALVEWNEQLEAKHITQWTPVLQRAYKLLINGGSSRNGILDSMMATFLIDYAKLLIKRFPIEAKELSTLHEKMVQKDELQKGQWRYRNLQKITIRQKSNKRTELPIHKQLLCRTLDLLESNENRLPMLSTPTHTPAFIDPIVLIKRLGQYQQANAVYADEAAKLKNTRLKNVLMKGDLTPEVVNNMLFSKNKSEIKTLYNSVGRVGRAQMRNGIIGKAMEKSGGSPDQFLRQLNILQNQTGITFKGQDAAYLKGLKNYLQSTQQAAKAAVTTPTGQQTIPFIIGYGTAMNPATTGAAVSYGLLTRAYESEPFRNAMLRMANTPRGSTAFEKAMQQAQKAINALTQGAKSDALSE